MARRRLAADLVSAGIYESVVGDAALVVSELLSNAIRHAAPLPGSTVRVAWTLNDDALRVAVSDAGGGPLPRVTQASPAAPGGRGLGIVETLSARWGVLRDEGETTVWAVLAAAPVAETTAPPVIPVADSAREQRNVPWLTPDGSSASQPHDPAAGRRGAVRQSACASPHERIPTLWPRRSDDGMVRSWNSMSRAGLKVITPL